MPQTDLGYVLITGASSGIESRFASSFAKIHDFI
jgi:short-subunit dehydrogenase